MLTPSVRRRLRPELERRVQSGLEGAESGDPVGRDLRSVLARARETGATDERVALALAIALALSTPPTVKVL